jgi:hypothetical protein
MYGKRLIEAGCDQSALNLYSRRFKFLETLKDSPCVVCPTAFINLGISILGFKIATVLDWLSE